MNSTTKKVSISKPVLIAEALKFASEDILSPSHRVDKAKGIKTAPRGSKQVSGLVPIGDVRLTANINKELHLKLKIAAAKQRTTIGELIEQLLEKYL